MQTALLSRFVSCGYAMGSLFSMRLVPCACALSGTCASIHRIFLQPVSRISAHAAGSWGLGRFFSDSDIGLLSWLALSFDDPSCHTPYPVLSLSLVSLPCLLHLRLRCIDSPAQSTPQPLPCPLFNTIPSTLLLLLLLFSYVFTWTVRVHTRTPPSFQPGCSHISQTLAWPCLCISTCIASVQLNSPPL